MEPNAPDSKYYCRTIVESAGVVCSLTGNFISGLELLLIVKHNSVELWADPSKCVDDKQLHLINTFTSYATIEAACTVPGFGDRPDLLCFATAGHWCLVEFVGSTEGVLMDDVHHAPLPYAAGPHDRVHLTAVSDGQSRIIAAMLPGGAEEVYTAHLLDVTVAGRLDTPHLAVAVEHTAQPLPTPLGGQTPAKARGTVVGMDFLYPAPVPFTGPPVLAVLARGLESSVLTLCEVRRGDNGTIRLEQGPYSVRGLSPDSTLLIPLPNAVFGVAVAGPTELRLSAFDGQTSSLALPVLGPFLSYTICPAVSSVILASTAGLVRLRYAEAHTATQPAVSIDRQFTARRLRTMATLPRVTAMSAYHTSRASWLYAGSTTGPAMLMRLDASDATDDLEAVVHDHVFCENPGSLTDAVCVDPSDRDHDVVLAVTGEGPDSRVSSGALGFLCDDLLAAGPDIEGYPDLFTFTLGKETPQLFAALSFVTHNRTRLFSVEMGTDSGALAFHNSAALGAHLLPDRSLLVAQACPDDSDELVVQVTAAEARLILGPGALGHAACRASVPCPDAPFGTAAVGPCGGKWLLCVGAGTRVGVYAINIHASDALVQVASIDVGAEPSVLKITDAGLVVGRWVSNSIACYSLTGQLGNRLWEIADVPAVPRSAQLVSTGTNTSLLLAGLSDGKLLSSFISPRGPTDPTLHQVGDTDVRLHPASGTNSTSFIATSTRSAVVFVSDRRVRVVPLVPLGNVVSAAPLLTPPPPTLMTPSLVHKRRITSLASSFDPCSMFMTGSELTSPSVPQFLTLAPLLTVVDDPARGVCSMKLTQARLCLGISWTSRHLPTAPRLIAYSHFHRVAVIVADGPVIHVVDGETLDPVLVCPLPEDTRVTAIKPFESSGRPLILLGQVTMVHGKATMPRVVVYQLEVDESNEMKIAEITQIPLIDTPTAITVNDDFIAIAENTLVQTLRLETVTTDLLLRRAPVALKRTTELPDIGSFDLLPLQEPYPGLTHTEPQPIAPPPAETLVVAKPIGTVKSFLGSTVVQLSPIAGGVLAVEWAGAVSIISHDGTILAVDEQGPARPVFDAVAVTDDTVLCVTDDSRLLAMQREGRTTLLPAKSPPRDLCDSDSESDGGISPRAQARATERLVVTNEMPFRVHVTRLLRGVFCPRPRLLDGALARAPADVCLTATSTGAMGLVTTVPASQYAILSQLSTAARLYASRRKYGLAELPTNVYSPGKHAIDGDLVARLLCLPRSELATIARQCNVAVEQIRSVIGRVEVLLS
ncbi:hypothetical protein J8273_1640 [Carpediemonas membranifera]|uniref:RSE1/DDB1/CPSF1 first beta-propeller domain-containing protein n=1 Tax=Carpediemonas membranifera TaxID=201153 RepID=A0A8J6E408_9EUKA|nr:hypothetical protein J8273_1640 [Carpediemonas membranifera]|eukprot:KAG9396623.1 hypothetical protein J8273_1640 [Carpediemonas membranifera]